MSKFTDELSKLVSNIMRGKCRKKKVKAELERIEAQYPDERFGFHVPERKQKPWNKEYLKDLEELFYCGASSKEFILYMAEVSDNLFFRKALHIVGWSMAVLGGSLLMLVKCDRFWAVIEKLFEGS